MVNTLINGGYLVAEVLSTKVIKDTSPNLLRKVFDKNVGNTEPFLNEAKNIRQKLMPQMPK